MKKVVFYILLLSAHNMHIHTQDINIRALQNEFARIGIYNPQSPATYNEQRAAEIIKKLDTKYYRALGDTLRRQQLESLQKAPAAGSNVEQSRLREENQRLRDRIKILEQKANEPRAERKPHMPYTREAELNSCKERMKQLHPLISNTITMLDDFERVILAFEYQVNESETGIWRWIYQQTNKEARRFISAAKKRMDEIHDIRESLEKLFISMS